MAAERPPSIGFMGTFKSVFRLRKTSSRAASVSSAQDSSLSQDNGQVSKEQDDSLSRSIRSHPTSPPPTSTSMISTDGKSALSRRSILSNIPIKADATDATRSLPEIVDGMFIRENPSFILICEEAAPAQGHIPGSQPTSTTSPTSISDSGRYRTLSPPKIIQCSKFTGKLLSRFKRFTKTPQAVNVEARGTHRAHSLFVFPPYYLSISSSTPVWCGAGCLAWLQTALQEHREVPRRHPIQNTHWRDQHDPFNCRRELRMTMHVLIGS